MANAKLGKQGVYGADLNAGTTAAVAQIRCIDVVLALGHEQRQSGKALDDVPACARPGESLEKLLKNQACRYDDFASLQKPPQRLHLGRDGRFIAAES